MNAMLRCKRLRIDSDQGTVDYRIEDGAVETRTLGKSSADRSWRRLTSDQLSAHVESNTVVAQWLKRRMGVHRLVRACTDFRPMMAA